MNIHKAYEASLAAAFVETAGLREMPRIRTWRFIDNDASWQGTDDRKFPFIGFRAAAPRTNEDGVTLVCMVQVLVGTHADDDQAHERVSELEGAAAALVDNLYAQFLNGSAGAERDAFDTHMSDAYPVEDAIINLGGFTNEGELEPFEEGGVNYAGVGIGIHYSRTDY